MRRIVLLLLLAVCFCSNGLQAQELKCKVTVNASKISGVEPRIFKTLENALNEFMNQRVWTTDVFATEERIECNIFIALEKVRAQDQYSATITVQSLRPAFNANYNSQILNFKDGDFDFTYYENAPLDFNMNSYTSNLTSVMGYWAYMIIGLDYESMAKGGGNKYFTMAETIMNNVPQNSAEAKGWRPFDSNPITGNRNRYQLTFSLMSSKYDVFKTAIYEYHREGIDLLYDKPEAGRNAIYKTLEKLEKVFSSNPNNVLITMFMIAKSDELTNIYSGAPQGERIKAVALIKKLDPSNGPKYDKILRM